MKRFILYLFGFFILLILNTNAQDTFSEQEIKNVLTNVLDFSKQNDFDKASKLLAYDGDDVKRKFTDVYNNNDKEEKNSIKRKCKKLKAYLDLSDSYEYTGFSISELEGHQVGVLNVNFKSGDQVLKIAFSFVKLNNGYALVSFK